MERKIARMKRGNENKSSFENLLSFFKLETKYQSRKNIKTPQSEPNAMAIGTDLNTVYNAYPPDKLAKIPVRKMTIPIPKNLL